MKFLVVFLGFASSVMVLACSDSDGDYKNQGLRMNEIQVLGTHNSYHIQPRDEILEVLAAIESQELADSLEYTALPLRDQLDRGVRQLEFDIFADPEGGLYASREGLRYIGEDTDSGLPELDEPGMKVLHIQDIDFETHCLTLQICLDQIKAWSDEHSRHLPITIMIGAKDDPIPLPNAAIPVPFGPNEVDDIDEEIVQVFPRERLIVPDDVRDNSATLEEAVLNGGWPTLEEARGRVMFVFLDEGDARDHYVDGHPSLEGRIMFTNSEEGEPEASWFKVDNALEDGERIRELVQAGYMVRTRSDEDTRQARDDDYTLQAAAFESGGQSVVTDYVVPNPDFGTEYHTAIPGGYAARCNPVSAPEPCESDLIAP